MSEYPMRAPEEVRYKYKELLQLMRKHYIEEISLNISNFKITRLYCKYMEDEIKEAFIKHSNSGLY